MRNAALGEKLDNRNKIMREIHAVQDVVPMNQAIHQCMLLLNDINITSLLSDIKAEVMVIQNSEGDPWLSKDDALLLVSSLAAAVNVYINNKSHLAPYTSPDKINSLIEIWV